MHVVVDHRERDGQVARQLAALPGVSVEVGRLPLGDYLVDGRLLAERKTIVDFAGSLRDGRLFRQARRLARHRPERVCVVLEGTLAEARRVAVTREALQGAVISLTVVFGLPLLRSRDAAETAQLLVYASGQLARVSLGLPRRSKSALGARDRARMELLQAIPGVGPLRARALLAHFRSIGALAAAPPREIDKVFGIGRPLAHRILWVLGDDAALAPATRPRRQGSSAAGSLAHPSDVRRHGGG